jgi:diguanylate cyclase (GGDEF)-like protein
MRHYWRNLALGTKISSIMGLLSIVFVILLTFISIERERANFRAALETQLSLLLEVTSLSLRDPLYRMQMDELADLARAVRDNREVTFLAIYDAKGSPLVDSRQSALLFYDQRPDPLGQTLVALPPGQTYMEWHTNELAAGQAISLGNQNIGAIAAGLSTAPLTEKINELTISSIAIAIAIALTNILLTTLLARQITHPLEELSNIARQMSQGDLKIRNKIDANDEIGKLAQVFNQMANSIEERETALRDFALSLEQTVAQRTYELRQKTDVLAQMAITDHLTQAYNRRHFFDVAEKEVERANLLHRPISIVILDADNFKRINDTFGHPTGDKVLGLIAKRCQENLRTGDIFARYGGEEFILLMPETDQQKALITAERLRKVIEEGPNIPDHPEIILTISLGLACSDGEETTSLTQLIAQADQALYISKQNGRNRVTLWKSE